MVRAKLVGVPVVREPADDFVVDGGTWQAKFHGACAIVSDHPIRKGSRIARVAPADNPMSPRQGYACAECVKRIQRRSGS